MSLAAVSPALDENSLVNVNRSQGFRAIAAYSFFQSHGMTAPFVVTGTCLLCWRAQYVPIQITYSIINEQRAIFNLF
jgi:hypothetical protein